MSLSRRPLLGLVGAALMVRPACGRITVTDHAGRTIDIADTSRVVSIGGSVTEIVYALGAGGQLVGVDTTSRYPEAATRLPQIGYMRQISAEGVLSLRPSLVLSTTAAGPAAAFDQLRSAGVATLVLPEDYEFTGVLHKIENIGHALGREPAATALIEACRGEMSALARMLSSTTSRPRVLSLLSIAQGSPLAAGSATGADGIIRLAGGSNAIISYEGYRPVTTEGVLTLAPEAIMVTTATLNAMGGIDGILKAASLGLTPAGRSRRVFALDALLLLGFGPRTAEAARRLAAFLHPELAWDRQ